MAYNVARRLTKIESFGGGQTATLNTVPAAGGLRFEKFREAYSISIETDWQAPVLTRITKLMALEEGWDSYGAPPIRRETGMFALEILEKVMQPGTPIPDIIPTSTGGVQIEWHEKGIDLELHVAAPYQCELWFEDHLGLETSVSLALVDNIAAFSTAVTILTRR